MNLKVKLHFYGLAFIGILMQQGCHTDTLKETIISSFNAEYQIDTIAIPIDSNTLPYYINYCNFSSNEKDYFIGFNKYYNTLDMFNLSLKKFERSIQLDNQGPNGVGSIESLYWINADSILLYSRQWFYIINDRGKLIDKLKLVDKNPEKEMINNSYFPLLYHKDENSVYFFNLYPKKEENLNKSLITQFNIKTKKFKELPISFSEYYIRNNGELGYLSWLNLNQIVNNQLVYNFQYESNIYSYNTSSKEHNSFGAASDAYNNLADLLKNNSPSEAWSRHALENTHFFGVIADPWKGLNYRFTWGNIVNKRDDGYYNSFFDKPLKLSVLDSEFKMIDEIDLPEYTININTWFVNETGLFVSPTHPKKREDVEISHLEFYVFKFNKR